MTSYRSVVDKGSTHVEFDHKEIVPAQATSTRWSNGKRRKDHIPRPARRARRRQSETAQEPHNRTEITNDPQT